MRFVAIILLFCVTVGGSALLAKFWLRDSVETEMEERARVVLGEAGFEGVQIKLDHLTGSLSGYVESPEEIGKVIFILREKLPAAYWPTEAETHLTIRPTLQPWLRVTRISGSDEAKVEGVLSANEEAGRTLLGSRLHAIPGIGKIDNLLTLDPKHLAFPKMVEFASLASGLLAHSDVAEISLRDGVIKITGTVPNDGIKAGLIEIAGQISPADPIDEITVKLPDTFLRVSDLKITRNRFGIVLTGTLPSETDRGALLSTLNGLTPAPEITDRLVVSTDCSKAVWQNHLPQILPALLNGLTGEMTAEFTSTQIRLHGTAPDEASVKMIEAGMSPFVAEQPAIEIVTEIANKTKGPADSEGIPLRAVYEGGLLVISGALPDTSIVAGITDRLAAVLPTVTIKSEIEVSPASPGGEWRSQLPEFFAEALSRIKSGTFTFSGNHLVMEGRTIALSDRQILQNIAVNTVPATYTIDNQLVHADQPIPKPELLPEVRSQLNASLKQLPAYFDTSSEVLKSEEKVKIASIAEMLKKTGAAFELVVTGFSDSVGNAESNRQLSLRRANAVMEELVRLEISKESMATASVVENVSDRPRSEKWKARRVEVSLKPVTPAAGGATPIP